MKAVVNHLLIEVAAVRVLITKQPHEGVFVCGLKAQVLFSRAEI